MSGAEVAATEQQQLNPLDPPPAGENWAKAGRRTAGLAGRRWLLGYNFPGTRRAYARDQTTWGALVRAARR